MTPADKKVKHNNIWVLNTLAPEHEPSLCVTNERHMSLPEKTSV